MKTLILTLVVSFVSLFAVAMVVGMQLGEGLERQRHTTACDQSLREQAEAYEAAENFHFGDGIRQGCEWCGGRCDGYMRGWRRAEEEERRGTRP
jgi:hypothetical protein